MVAVVAVVRILLIAPEKREDRAKASEFPANDKPKHYEKMIRALDLTQ